jgi:hypothetical protein
LSSRILVVSVVTRDLALIDVGLADPLAQHLRVIANRRASAVITAYSDG